MESGYRYASPAKAGSDNAATARFEFTVPEDGDYEVRVSHQPHENRSSKTSVTVESATESKTTVVNQRVAPPLDKGFFGLGVYSFKKDQPGAVIFTNAGADGNVSIDAVQVILQR